jgi:hypothetical protein
MEAAETEEFSLSKRELERAGAEDKAASDKG